MSRALARSERRPNDAYYTPDELAAALVDLLPIRGGCRVLEPSMGGGAFVRAIKHGEWMPHRPWVWGLDIDPDAHGFLHADNVECIDFLDWQPDPERRPEWVIGNPPYSGAMEHVLHALEVTDRHVAFLLRLAFLESAKRAPFWASAPLRKVWVLAERPSFTGGGTDSAAYGFFWWDHSWTREARIEVMSWKQ